jgi:hypothetical protein
MSDGEKKPGTPHWLLAAIVVFLLYALSAGPIVFMDGAGRRPNDAILVLYWPLELFARVPVVGRLLSDYCDAFRHEGRRFRHR